MEKYVSRTDSGIRQAYFPVKAPPYGGNGRRKYGPGWLFVCVWWVLGLTVLTNRVVGADLDGLHDRLEELEVIDTRLQALIREENKVLREQEASTDPKLRQHLQDRLRNILQEVDQDVKSKYDLFAEAVKLLEGYRPDTSKKAEAAIEEIDKAIGEAEHLIVALRKTRDAITTDLEAPKGLREIDSWRNSAKARLRFLNEEKGKLQNRRLKLSAWFEAQDPAVKAAVIGAFVSVFGSLAGIIVAMIRRGSS